MQLQAPALHRQQIILAHPATMSEATTFVLSYHTSHLAIEIKPESPLQQYAELSAQFKFSGAKPNNRSISGIIPLFIPARTSGEHQSN